MTENLLEHRQVLMGWFKFLESNLGVSYDVCCTDVYYTWLGQDEQLG